MLKRSLSSSIFKSIKFNTSNKINSVNFSSNNNNNNNSDNDKHESVIKFIQTPSNNASNKISNNNEYGSETVIPYRHSGFFSMSTNTESSFISESNANSKVPKVVISPKVVKESKIKHEPFTVPYKPNASPAPESWLARGKFLPNEQSPHDDFYKIFEFNQQWIKKKKEEDPQFFEKLSTAQTPRYLYLGCSDSRVDAYEITGLTTGSMFIHRNIANLVVASDMNFLAVLQYAVEFLHVKDIMVVGHYGCGGVKASMENVDLGLVENWLRNLRDIQRIHSEELTALSDKEERYRRLVELNVYEQCLNIYKTGIVQSHVRKYGYPRVHGLVYELKEGLLKQLDIDFEGYINKYQYIYAIGKKKKEDDKNKK